jgi:hypothetical protein
MIKDECRYLIEEPWSYEFICTKQQKKLTDEEIDNCEYGKCALFEELKSCCNCKHSSVQIYETGTIDDIEYRCTLQNNKLIYDDGSPYQIHYADFPLCNINRFESIG